MDEVEKISSSFLEFEKALGVDISGSEAFLIGETFGLDKDIQFYLDTTAFYASVSSVQFPGKNREWPNFNHFELWLKKMADAYGNETEGFQRIYYGSMAIEIFQFVRDDRSRVGRINSTLDLENLAEAFSTIGKIAKTFSADVSIFEKGNVPRCFQHTGEISGGITETFSPISILVSEMARIDGLKPWSAPNLPASPGGKLERILLFARAYLSGLGDLSMETIETIFSEKANHLVVC